MSSSSEREIETETTHLHHPCSFVEFREREGALSFLDSFLSVKRNTPNLRETEV